MRDVACLDMRLVNMSVAELAGTSRVKPVQGPSKAVWSERTNRIFQTLINC